MASPDPESGGTSPSPSPLHAMTPADVSLHFSRFDVWYPLFKKHSPKATVIDVVALQPGFEEWLEQDGMLLPKDSGAPGDGHSSITEVRPDGTADEDQDAEQGPDFTALNAKIRETISSYDGAVYPKLIWSAPQDAAWIVAGSSLRCTSPADVYMLLKSSDFVAKDVSQAKELSSMSSSSNLKFSLILKKWFDMPTSHEFRCFVRSGHLVGICQRDLTFFEHLQPSETQQAIRERIASFFHAHLEPKKGAVVARTLSELGEAKKGNGVPLDDYVFDVYLTRDMAKVFLVDVNPFLPRTDALLWSWEEVEERAAQLASGGVVEEEQELPPLRLLTSMTQSVQSAPKHARNMLPHDVLEASDGKSIAEFAKSWQDELAKASAGTAAAEGGAAATIERDTPPSDVRQPEEQMVPASKDVEEAAPPAKGQKGVRFDAQDKTDEHDDEEPAPIAVAKPSRFAALGAEDDEDEDDSDEAELAQAAPSAKSKKRNAKKKKKQAAEAPASPEGMARPTPAKASPKPKSTPGKKTAKKAPASSKSKDISSMSMDELTALLSSTKTADKKRSGEGDLSSADGQGVTSENLSALRPLLSLSAPALDPAVELKRQFGSAAIKAFEAESGGSPSSGARARAQAMNSNLKSRNILVQPKDTWPPIARTFTGMAMETLEHESKGRIAGWVHSRAYKQVELRFLDAVRTFDPNQLIALWQSFPWHVNTLLQLSDVSRHQGDLGQASDWNARVLFAFERTAMGAFVSGLVSSAGPTLPGLDFSRVENRGFWLASHRQINFLGRRGTWRTALEWTKLMLSLDPVGDPHAMLLWLDFLAIKSRQHRWLLGVLPVLDAAVAADADKAVIPARTPLDSEDRKTAEEDGQTGALDWCLGLSYARALALRAVEKEEHDEIGARSTAALRLAIARHPIVLPSLFDKIGITFPSELRAHPLFVPDKDTLPELLAQIYVARNESLWKEAPVAEWLKKTLNDMWPRLEKGAKKVQPAIASGKQRMAVYRHVVVSDLPDSLRQTLIGFFPSELTSKSSLDAWDPLPPTEEGSTRYDDAYFEPVRRQQAREAGFGGQGGQAGPAEMGRLMDIFRRIMGQARGPGGGADGGQQGGGGADNLVDQLEFMDEEMRDDILAQMIQIGGGGRGAMPGGFGGDEDDEDDDWEEAEE